MAESVNQSKFAIFQNADGEPTVAARFENDDVWLTQKHLALLYKTTKQNVSQHIQSIFDSGELSESSCVKKFFTVEEKFGRPAKIPVYHYNLDLIIALGYRIDSPVAIKFRQWATARLHEYIQKGFALDDERLKQGGNRYFKELLQRIRDIRASERNWTIRSRVFAPRRLSARVMSRMRRRWPRPRRSSMPIEPANSVSSKAILTRR